MTERLLILDRGPRDRWRLGDREPVFPTREDQVAGEFVVVVWGDPPFELSPDRLGALGAPRIVSTRDDVVARARALGLTAHRVPELHPSSVRRVLADDPDLVGVPAGTVDLATGEIWSASPARLTETERRLLRLLAGSPEAVDREVLQREGFGYGPAVVSRAVDAAVARLRRKLGSGSVVTAYGRGYRFVPIASTPEAPASPRPARALRFDRVVIDLDRLTARLDGVERPLTDQDRHLLELLDAARPGRVDRRAIARALGVSDRAVTDAVRRLRRKVEPAPADPQLVVACEGGYRLGPEPTRVPSPAEARTLAALSAFADPFSLEDGARLVGDPAMRDLVERGWLTGSDGRYRPAIGGSPPASAVAAHARWAVDQARLALDARDRIASIPGVAELGRAWSALEPTDPEGAGVVATAGALLVDLPPAERLGWIERAQRRPPPKREALLWVARATTEFALGRPGDAERSALEGIRTEPTVVSAFTTAHLLAVLRGDASAALARLDEADAQFPPGSRPMSRASIARSRAWWAIRQGRPAEAQQVALGALGLLATEVRAPGHVLGRRNRGVVEVHGQLLQVLAVALRDRGHLVDALEAIDEAVAELARLPLQNAARMARMTRSEVLAALGRPGEARLEMDRVLAEADQAGHAEHIALAAAHQVSLAVAAGDLGAARRWIEARGPAIRASGHLDAIAVLDRAEAGI